MARAKATSCLHCGKTFLVKPSRAARGGGKYCSRQCHSSASTQPVPTGRFWSRVDKSGPCWLWTGYRFPNGYGHFQFKSNGIAHHLLAHRFSWELAHGPIPDGLQVNHNCPGGDNRLCVNPAHLWLGTQKDNVADARTKGRLSGGIRTTILTEADVRAIRHLCREGVCHRILAQRFGVCKSYIGAIVLRTSWRHVTD